VQGVNQDVPVPFAPRGAASPDFIHRVFPHSSLIRSSYAGRETSSTTSALDAASCCQSSWNRVKKKLRSSPYRMVTFSILTHGSEGCPDHRERVGYQPWPIGSYVTRVSHGTTCLAAALAASSVVNARPEK
jgi:hypothetical protein